MSFVDKSVTKLVPEITTVNSSDPEHLQTIEEETIKISPEVPRTTMKELREFGTISSIEKIRVSNNGIHELATPLITKSKKDKKNDIGNTDDFTASDGGESSLSSEYDFETVPTPIKMGHDNSLIPLDRSILNTPSNPAYDEVFEEDTHDEMELETIKRERRRSSKRAMSSSNDDYLKYKTRLSLSGNIIDTQNSPSCNGNLNNNSLHLTNDMISMDFQGILFASHFALPSAKHCKLITSVEATSLLIRSYNKVLPKVEKMFPWLHGIHKDNYGQISFLSNSLNSKSENSKPRIISFERPASLDENNYQEEEEDGYNEDDEFAEQMDDYTKLMRTPEARFLMPIRSCNTNGEPPLKASDMIAESMGLLKGNVSPDDILIPYSKIVNLEVFLQERLPKFVFKDYHIEAIITDCIITGLTPVFQNLDPEVGINLRNFHIQVSKISNISDFVVYCFNDHDHEKNMKLKDDVKFVNNNCKCLNIARLLHIAQIVYQYHHPEIIEKLKPSELLNEKKYNTFIISDPDVELFEKSHVLAIPLLDSLSSTKKEGELCSQYDLSVFNNWDSNYLYRERLEISRMSSATPINGHLWLGNITDYECLQIRLNKQKMIDPLNDNEVRQIVKQQKHNAAYYDPLKTTVKLVKEDFVGKRSHEELDQLLISFPPTMWRFYIKCVEGAKVPTLEHLKLIYDNYKDCEYINIEFPPSGSMTMADMSDAEILSIVNICKFCYYILSEDFPGLIFCSDGYTESSLISLCYLMYAENICLDEAILKLHMEYGRPFFLFKTDYSLLKKLECILNKFSPENDNENENMDARETRDNFAFESDVRTIRSLLLLMPKRKPLGTVGAVGQTGQTGQRNVGGGVRSNSVSANTFVTSTGHHVVQYRDRGRGASVGGASVGVGVNSGRSHAAMNSSSVNNSFNKNKPVSIDGCLEEVFGSLPSRIMQHMYLGSLLHASDIPMLSRLGIEYVVSVGETVSWLEEFKHESHEDANEPGVYYYDFENGQMDSESGYRFPIKKAIVLKNINDDGIGTLIATIDRTLAFIDEVYSSGGKVLVHCQVGVSRSASVCIAEVMKRNRLSLPRAYMYVRVRRLNVIIQPNLKLMYELCKWEESHLIKNRKRNEYGGFEYDVVSNFKCCLREVEWGVLCREIFNLNKAYIK